VSESRPDSLLLGLDIGGTKIGLSVGTPDGRVLARESVQTDHASAPEQILGACRERLLGLAKASGKGKAASLGAACPGPLSYAEGRFLNPPNMPRWHGFRLRDWLAANFECPTAMMNDANACALAEWKWGAARGKQTAVFLTMSTGMGAGLIIDGRLYEGPLGLAGEIGRLRFSREDEGPVGFGRRGSVEGYCSGPGMAQAAVAEVVVCTHTGEATALQQILSRDGTISTEALCDAARKGDAAAVRVIDRCARELGRLLAVLTDILNPEVFVLGTIGTAYPDLFIPRAAAVLHEIAIPAAAAIVEVRPSGLSNRGDQSALAVALVGSPQATRPVA
jgi:glucokinase